MAHGRQSLLTSLRAGGIRISVISSTTIGGPESFADFSQDCAADAVVAKMKAKYGLLFNDDFTIDLKQKDNPQLDVLNKGGQKVNFSDALIEVLTADKMITKLEQQQQGGGQGDRGEDEAEAHVQAPEAV